MATPIIQYKTTEYPPDAASWNLRDNIFVTQGTVKRWSFFQLYDSKKKFMSLDELKRVTGGFHRELTRLGVGAAPPNPPTRIPWSDNSSWDGPAQKLRELAASNDLLVIVIPFQNTPLYNNIKKLCDQHLGIHTLVCVDAKIAKNQTSYHANVGMKFNLKLGGMNHQLDLERDHAMKILEKDTTMLVGLDVTHPSPGSAPNAPSVAGMVASVDKFLGQFPGILRRQAKAKDEMVSDLNEMLKSRLELWRANNRGLPNNIVVYRDGVSEGQYNAVLSQEVDVLRQACSEFYSAEDTRKNLPRLTVVVVGKRHKVRFYATTHDTADKTKNPIPGTVVDRGVTEAQNWDFYLQAHGALQGTARPGHYFTVCDEVFRHFHSENPKDYSNAGELLIDFTHKLCYDYGRATKAVSLAPPAYYADLLCERARKYLDNLFEVSSDADVEASIDLTIHPKLENTMFYI